MLMVILEALRGQRNLIDPYFWCFFSDIIKKQKIQRYSEMLVVVLIGKARQVMIVHQSSILKLHYKVPLLNVKQLHKTSDYACVNINCNIIPFGINDYFPYFIKYNTIDLNCGMSVGSLYRYQMI